MISETPFKASSNTSAVSLSNNSSNGSEQNNNNLSMLEEQSSSSSQGSAFYRLYHFLIENRFIEFIILLIFGVLATAIQMFIKPANRAILPIEIQISESQSVFALDPAYKYDLVPSEQVSTFLLVIISIICPAVFVLLMKHLMPAAIQPFQTNTDIQNFFVSIAMSLATANAITSFIKTVSGGLRPNFFAICKWDTTLVWDGVTNLCTSASGEMKGRQSFPSGHSSTAFAGLFLLSLYLAGRFQLNASRKTTGVKRLALVFTSILPTALAAWIAVTRINDNYHHPVDVLCGSGIGIATALLGYYYNFGDILSNSPKVAGVPKSFYKQDSTTLTGGGFTSISSPK